MFFIFIFDLMLELISNLFHFIAFIGWFFNCLYHQDVIVLRLSYMLCYILSYIYCLMFISGSTARMLDVIMAVILRLMVKPYALFIILVLVIIN